jgi:hypothetical protein
MVQQCVFHGSARPRSRLSLDAGQASALCAVCLSVCLSASVCANSRQVAKTPPARQAEKVSHTALLLNTRLRPPPATRPYYHRRPLPASLAVSSLPQSTLTATLLCHHYHHNNNSPALPLSPCARLLRRCQRTLILSQPASRCSYSLFHSHPTPSGWTPDTPHSPTSTIPTLA